MQRDYREYQLRLFATLVKWFSMVTIIVVLINSYFLLVDFWPTLIQNGLSLAIVAVGLLCLRWARGGRPELAIPLYLTVTMLVMGLLIPFLSAPFMLNGALGLGLAVMLATSLEPPDRALRWVFLSIAVYMGGLTVRLLGLPGGLGLSVPDTVTMYLLPAVALLGIAMLGRNATSRIREALDATEMARQELENGAAILREAQASLETTNEQLRTELDERHRAEQALQTSLDETARGQQLVLALSKAAQAMQRARTAEEIYDSLNSGLAELGRGAIVLRSRGDGQWLEIVGMTYDPGTLAMLETGIGFPLLGYSVEVPPDSRIEETITKGAILATDQTGDYIRPVLPASLQPMVDPLLDQLGAKRTIFAPLVAGNEVHGLFAVGGSGMSTIEDQAISTFANQTAVALANMRHLQEIQNWATELELRVGERTAALAASEARYRRLFDGNRDALYVVDSEGRCLDANPAACELLGHSREDMLALDILQASPQARGLSPQEQARYLEEIRADWQEGLSSEETELLHKDGRTIPVEVSVTPLTYRGKEAILAAVRDITARKQAEAELNRSQAETLRHHHRLLDLSQAAQAVQRAQTPLDVYKTVGNEVRKLGFQAIVFALSADRSYLTIPHVTFELGALHEAEGLVGAMPDRTRVHFVPDALLRQVIDEGASAFVPLTADRVAKGLPGMDRTAAERLLALLGISQSIICPLRVGGETQDLLMVTGDDLIEGDVPAISILANQAAIALENAQLMEEQRDRRARMQQLAREVVSAQEDERRRLSHALHDEAGQALTALKINLELISQDLAPEARPIRERLGSAVSMVDGTMNDIRQMAQGLRPPALDTVGLDATLAGFCSDFGRRTRLRVTYQGQDVSRLPEPVSITLYRFLQEALTNVARHAEATEVQVLLQQDAEAIQLTVEDDGRGFDVQRESSPDHGAGMGLAGMWDRLQSLDGHLETNSRPGQGTRLTAHIPLQAG